MMWDSKPCSSLHEALAAEVYTPARAKVPPAAATEPNTGIKNHMQAGIC